MTIAAANHEITSIKTFSTLNLQQALKKGKIKKLPQFHKKKNIEQL